MNQTRKGLHLSLLFDFFFFLWFFDFLCSPFFLWWKKGLQKKKCWIGESSFWLKLELNQHSLMFQINKKNQSSFSRDQREYNSVLCSILAIFFFWMGISNTITSPSDYELEIDFSKRIFLLIEIGIETESIKVNWFNPVMFNR